MKKIDFSHDEKRKIANIRLTIFLEFFGFIFFGLLMLFLSYLNGHYYVVRLTFYMNVHIPVQTCHSFRNMPATCSGVKLPPIPVETCRF